MHRFSLRAVIGWVAVVLAVPSPGVRAAGVVGRGTAASCTDDALNAALVDGGRVTFNCGAAATIDISLGSGTKVIAHDTVIDGAGRITLSGGGREQLFAVPSDVTLDIANLTLADGYASASIPISKASGAIENAGTLRMRNSALVGNRGALGGAIRNTGTLIVTDSTFAGNVGAVAGGTINNIGTATISGSTFDANAGSLGGAIHTGPGTLTVTNSTFVGNRTFNQGGAILSLYGDPDALTVINCTFAGNDPATVGSVERAILINTILALDVPIGANCFGTIVDGGHNLEDGTSCGFAAANESLSSTEPGLDPAGLRGHGGRTDTVALCTGVGVPEGCAAASPALAAGDPAACAAAPVNNLDQRGFVRPATDHGRCSIGAYDPEGAAPAGCIGDCDASGRVTVDELVAGVRLSLRNESANACTALDDNHDDAVTIDELIAAVRSALQGCASNAQAAMRGASPNPRFLRSTL